DEQVIEELGVPEAPEIFGDDLLGGVVIRHPDALRRNAGFLLDVIDVSLRLDDRRVALGFETGGDVQNDGGCARRRLSGRASLLAADRGYWEIFLLSAGGNCERQQRSGHGGRRQPTSEHCAYFRLSGRLSGRLSTLLETALRPRSAVKPASARL